MKRDRWVLAALVAYMIVCASWTVRNLWRWLS